MSSCRFESSIISTKLAMEKKETCLAVNSKESSRCSNEKSNQIKESETENSYKIEVSSLRIIASQCVASIPVIFSKIRLGTGNGFSIVLIPELAKKNAEIHLTLDELTWFSSHCFVEPVASIFGGFIAQFIGVRRLLMCTYLLLALSDFLFYWSGSVAMLLVAQAIVGFTRGISNGPGTTYVAEIVQPKYRSTIMSAVTLTQMSGRLFASLLGTFIYWRTQTLIYLIFPILGFVSIHFMPDSPQWLANKNRYEDAAKSLARLRGWTTPAAVKDELYSSISNATDSLSSTKTTPRNDLPTKKRSKLKMGLSLYFDRSFYIPLLTLIFMYFFLEFSGIKEIEHFSGIIFDKIKSPINGYIANIIFSVLNIVSAFVYIFSVRLLGKRILTLASVFTTSVCLIVALTFLYLINNNHTAPEIYSWTISIALIGSSFVHNFGIAKIIHIINSELYPQKLRYVGAGIGLFVNSLLSALLSKLFLYIIKGITFEGTLIVFIIVNFISFVVIYFILPETEGVSLLQIEEHYTGIHKLKNKYQP